MSCKWATHDSGRSLRIHRLLFLCQPSKLSYPPAGIFILCSDSKKQNVFLCHSCYLNSLRTVLLLFDFSEKCLSGTKASIVRHGLPQSTRVNRFSPSYSFRRRTISVRIWAKPNISRWQKVGKDDTEPGSISFVHESESRRVMLFIILHDCVWTWHSLGNAERHRTTSPEHHRSLIGACMNQWNGLGAQSDY